MPKLSVVLPTLNCIDHLPEHVKTMREWQEFADEIIVVDSFSDDGTPEYLAANVRHSNLKILSRPRGLYQSWNHGIADTTGDWIYISTAGDGMSRALLQHLIDTGEQLGCDVVASRPDFVKEDGTPCRRPTWPIDLILKSAGALRPTKLSGPEAVLFGLFNIPCAVLGSSASNIYRGSHLRERPFPTEFGTVGDTAWSLRYGLNTRYGFTPQRGSFFRFHVKAYSPSTYAVTNLVSKLADYAAEHVRVAGQPPEVQAQMVQLRLEETAALLAAKHRRSVARQPRDQSAAA